MASKDGYPLLYAIGVATDAATTDAATIAVPVPGNSSIAVRRVTVYNSRILATEATADNSTGTIGVFTAAGGGGVTIVANAAMTTLTGNTVVSDRTVAATALTPKVTASTLYIRVGTASGVTGSGVDVAIEYSVLPNYP